MKDHGILMSCDGPQQNVIKIKPRLTFTIENAKEVIFYLHKIFGEDFMQII
jgi:4-aminobutyrate aminotransferase-like enzyme